jgi:hypothetical protein
MQGVYFFLRSKIMLDYYLTPNKLTNDPEDYSAVVFRTNMITREMMAEEISTTMGGITQGQVAQFMDAADVSIMRHVGQADSMQLGPITITYSMRGKCAGVNAEYIPGQNRVVVNAHVSRAMTARAQSAPRVKHIGVVNGPVISSITDMLTLETNGTIHANGNARMLGRKIKILGGATTVGIYFRNVDGDPIEVPGAAIFGNTANKLSFVVPNLSPGIYTVSVTTQYSGGGKLSDTPLSFTFPTPITVVA